MNNLLSHFNKIIDEIAKKDGVSSKEVIIVNYLKELYQETYRLNDRIEQLEKVVKEHRVRHQHVG